MVYCRPHVHQIKRGGGDGAVCRMVTEQVQGGRVGRFRRNTRGTHGVSRLLRARHGRCHLRTGGGAGRRSHHPQGPEGRVSGVHGSAVAARPSGLGRAE